jgi:lipopolysaccharide/colanic/teichoic acid biosynthesis glycosyltransferase
MKKRTVVFLILDIFIVFFAFLLAAFFKTGKEKALFNYYWIPFLIFEFVWIGTSLIFGKYNLDRLSKQKDYLMSIVKSNLLVLLSITFVIFFASLSYSRLIVFQTVIYATIVEGILSYLIIQSKVLNKSMDALDQYIKAPKVDKKLDISDSKVSIPTESLRQRKQLIDDEVGKRALAFIEKKIQLGDPEILITSTTNKFNILNQQSKAFKSIVNLKRINDFDRINKFFETINSKLFIGGVYINFAETKKLRKTRILAKYPPIIDWIVYTTDFIFNRVMPKLWTTKRIYFFLTKGRNRVISKAETFGRLYSCGFEIVDEELIDGLLYFVCRKVGEPVFDTNPTYGPLVKLRRYGKNGKKIGVYKMRTMHPYSEYLQDYIFEKNKLQEGGKFADDFRITYLGRFFRKFWLDELPMFINVFRGEMKIVGVRPLSEQYFNLYNEELKSKRLNYKPGLIPPFYVDMPTTLDEIMESELRYLEAYDKKPFLTDLRYFFIAGYNILFKKARSK